MGAGCRRTLPLAAQAIPHQRANPICAVCVSRTQVYDHVAQILHWTTYRRWRAGDEEHTRVTRIAVRFTFPQELAALLHYNGFSILRQYGDWNHEPLAAASPSIISVCRVRV